MEEFGYILILLASAVVMISICRRAHLPPILGYLLVGVLVGPGGLAWIPSIEEMHFLAEFGVVFLMFALGLEFSIPKLLASKKYLVGLGGTQVAVCTAIGWGAGLGFGLDPRQAFIIGAALALSSTAVVVKQLGEQKEQASLHGSLSINILLFQDIAAVLFLIIVPAISGNQNGESLQMTFLITFAKGVGVVIGFALVGLYVLRPLFHEVAKARSTELFMLATLLVVLAAAGITHYLHLSMALGAFTAGMMLGETEFRHQIELDIRPFRDVLLGLFFIVIGAYLELNLLPENWLQVLLILFALIFGKTIIIMLSAMAFGTKSKSAAFRTGFILAHGGEFGFIVLTVAIQNNLISADQRSAIFSALVISVLLAPLMIRFNKTFSKAFFGRKLKKDKEVPPPGHQLSEHVAELKDHVILCGFGRVGQILARFLEAEDIPWIALDLDPMRVSKASTAGEKTFYGDATNPATLLASGLAKARMVVISFDEEAPAFDVLEHVRSMRLDLPVFIRTKDDSSLQKFQEAGATEVVPEALEGGLMLASHLLLTLGVSGSKILHKVREVHAGRYEILRGMYKGGDEFKTFEEHESARRSLHSIVIHDNAGCIGKQLDDIMPEGEEGAVIKAVIREGVKLTEPSMHMEIRPHDVIVVFASPEEYYLIEEIVNYK